MSLFGRREKRENVELRRDKERLVAKVALQGEELAAAHRSQRLSVRREAEMAARIVRLEREARAKDAAVTRLGKQLDDAVGVHAKPGKGGDLDAAGLRETERRERDRAKAGGRT
ncbi:hypothetical protein [Streptomyces sp. NPDC088733]|uniref:hypothetical protein n=1 Tax=Streptomyces sp. NPDC088733 TaxID=3365880 RepID=UPI00380FB204